MLPIWRIAREMQSEACQILDRPQTAFPAHFDIIYTLCNDHDTSCAVTKLDEYKRSAIWVKILNNLKKTSKTGRNLGFKEYFTLGKSRKQFKFVFDKTSLNIPTACTIRHDLKNVS